MSRKPNPRLEQLLERVARLEERVNSLNGELNELKQCIKRLDNRLWWILGGVVLSVLLALIRLAV